MIYGLDIKIGGNAFSVIAEFAKDRRLYADMLFDAWGTAVDRMFVSQGFGSWSPLAFPTIKRRGYRSPRGRRHHYDKNVIEDATDGYPANTFSGKLRDTVAGRALRGYSPKAVAPGDLRIPISSKLSYASYALIRRKIDMDIMVDAVNIMSDIISKRVRNNFESVTARFPSKK